MALPPCGPTMHTRWLVFFTCSIAVEVLTWVFFNYWYRNLLAGQMWLSPGPGATSNDSQCCMTLLARLRSQYLPNLFVRFPFDSADSSESESVPCALRHGLFTPPLPSLTSFTQSGLHVSQICLKTVCLNVTEKLFGLFPVECTEEMFNTMRNVVL